AGHWERGGGGGGGSVGDGFDNTTHGLKLMPETTQGIGTTSVQVQRTAATGSDWSQPGVMTTVAIKAGLRSTRVVLINDYEGQGVPVLRFSTEMVKVDGSGFLQDLSIVASARVESSFFNIKVVRWEPLIEPWVLRVKLSSEEAKESKGVRRMTLKVSSNQVLVFCLTSQFMETFLSSYWMLFSEGGGQDGAFSDIDEDEVASQFSDTTTTTQGPGLLSGEGELSASFPPSPPPSPLIARVSSAGNKGNSPSDPTTHGVTPVEGVKEGHVVLKNRTGLGLRVSTSDSPQKKTLVGPMETSALSFNRQKHRSRSGEFDLRGKTVLVGWDGEEGQGGLDSMREPLPDLLVDRTGVKVYSLVPLEAAPAGYVVSEPVLEESWQNQRFENFTRQWRVPYLLGDRPEFSNKHWSNRKNDAMDSRELRLEKFTLPDEKWEWLDEWHVDMSREVGREIDSSGWEYAVDFSGFEMTANMRTHRDLDQARRRRWIRTRAPKPLPVDDPYRPLSVAWQVDVTPQGRLEVMLRSTIQVVNGTNLSIQLAANLSSAVAVAAAVRAVKGTEPLRSTHGGNDHSVVLGVVAPGATLDVPVLLTYSNHLRIRPVSSSSTEIGAGGGEEGSYLWSGLVPVFVSNVDRYKDSWVACRQAAGGGGGGGGAGAKGDVIRMVVHTEATAERCVVVTVLPPVSVTNSLPCPLRFQVVSAQGGSDSVVEYGVVPTAETADLHKVRLGGGPRLSARLAYHEWSSPQELLRANPKAVRGGGGGKQLVTFRLPCKEGGFLDLHGCFEPLLSPTCPASRLEIYCRQAAPFSPNHWLIDRSGLGLRFGIKKHQLLPAPGNLVDASHSGWGREEEGGAETVHISPVRNRGRDVAISELSCRNSSGCSPARAVEGSPLYSDRPYTFTKGTLPPHLRGATMIRTSNADKGNANQHFLR
ncbi:unnamed protein product, partial [Discosporangium mesarthrocarpum]